MRYKIRKLLLNLLSIEIINKLITKSYLMREALWKTKRFVADFPWWNKSIHNWIDLFLIFLNMKKSSSISFKNGFVFKNCNKKNWHFLSFYVNDLLERNIEFINRNEKIVARIQNKFIIYPDLGNARYSINGIFINNDYDKFDYNNKIVVDIGGYVGDSAIYFVLKGAKKVYVYEINDDSFSLLKENIKINHAEDKIVAFNQGIANESKKEKFYITVNQQGSGIYSNIICPEKVIGEKIIESVSFKDILFEPIDILKMDCEGCEYDILENILDNNLMNKIKEGVILEAHYIDESRNIGYLKFLLNKIGFKDIHFYGKSGNIIYSVR